jgi:arginyl-tRNA--protein-N-Asp/Glu arginylyltransferase
MTPTAQKKEKNNGLSRRLGCRRSGKTNNRPRVKHARQCMLVKRRPCYIIVATRASLWRSALLLSASLMFAGW